MSKKDVQFAGEDNGYYQYVCRVVKQNWNVILLYETGFSYLHRCSTTQETQLRFLGQQKERHVVDLHLSLWINVNCHFCFLMCFIPYDTYCVLLWYMFLFFPPNDRPTSPLSMREVSLDFRIWARILVQVTINRRLLIGRDGHLDQSPAYDLS